MSNKSLFDKLFNEVMQSDAGQTDEEALGISQDVGGEDSGSEFGGEESEEGFGEEEGGEEVTLTLDKATAQALKDILDAALGGGLGEEESEDEGDEGDEDLGGEFGGSEEESSEDEAGAFGESPAVETMEELPTQKYVDAMTGKDNKVKGALTSKTTGHGEGSGEVTAAHPLKKMSMTYNDGKGSKNRVNSDKYKEKNTKTSSYLTQ
jgi:hypothetical protein